MRSHVDSALVLFKSGCDRAAGLKAIHDYLKKNAPEALNCDDILRSALVLAVSSFDLYIHDVFRLEVIDRLFAGIEVQSFRVPFTILHLNTDSQATKIDECIRKDNSYRSFVAPDKLAECLKAFLENPWEQISHHYGENASYCKSRLKKVVDLRNRIAHEADVNPTYGGLELWPIYSEDVAECIDFLRDIGRAIASAIIRCR